MQDLTPGLDYHLCMIKFENYKLGENDELVEVTTSEEHRTAAIMMLQQAHHSIDIVSRELDPLVYDTPQFAEAARHLILTGVRPRIRVIVSSPETIVRRGHRLVETAMNLTSFFDLRKAGEEHKNFNISLFVVDATGYIRRLSSERYEGTLNFNDRRESQLLMNEFEEMWAKAVPDINLRRLSL